jgi:hypothetical protein
MKNTRKSIIITTWPSSTTRSSPPGSTRAARARWPIIDAVVEIDRNCDSRNFVSKTRVPCYRAGCADVRVGACLL